MLIFALFLILGWAAFANPLAPTRTVLMIIFTVLMVLWLLFGLGVLPATPYIGGRW